MLLSHTPDVPCASHTPLFVPPSTNSSNCVFLSNRPLQNGLAPAMGQAASVGSPGPASDGGNGRKSIKGSTMLSVSTVSIVPEQGGSVAPVQLKRPSPL